MPALSVSHQLAVATDWLGWRLSVPALVLGAGLFVVNVASSLQVVTSYEVYMNPCMGKSSKTIAAHVSLNTLR
jgi:hypothetical protein